MASLTTGGPEFLVPLREHTEKLHALLSDPHPGLVTWCLFVCEQWKAISDLYFERASKMTERVIRWALLLAGALSAAVLITGIARVLAAGWPR